MTMMTTERQEEAWQQDKRFQQCVKTFDNVGVKTNDNNVDDNVDDNEAAGGGAAA